MGTTACDLVRATTARVAAAATRCVIDDAAVRRTVEGLSPDAVTAMCRGPWDAEGWHFRDLSDPELTSRYLLCVDAVNFCFWPDHDARGSSRDGLEYEHVAGGLARALEEDRSALNADVLAEVTGPDLRRMLRWPRPLPMEEERARLLREVGAGLIADHGGSAAAMIASANGSAPTLVDVVVRTFPGFRDAVVDPRDGRQVFLYKRAQIFVGDVWGCFQGEGLGDFGESIEKLTMFADYRVPVVLRQMGVLVYDDALATAVNDGRTIAAGSPEEIEIRAGTVQAVERVREALQERLERTPELAGEGGGGRGRLTSVAIDWFLWNLGESARDEAPPHHRTLTVYY